MLRLSADYTTRENTNNNAHKCAKKTAVCSTKCAMNYVHGSHHGLTKHTKGATTERHNNKKYGSSYIGS